MVGDRHRSPYQALHSKFERKLLVTQSHNWVDTGRTVCRDIAREERNAAKQKRHSSKRGGIGGLHAIEQACEKPSKAARGNDSETKTGECHSCIAGHPESFPS